MLTRLLILCLAHSTAVQLIQTAKPLAPLRRLLSRSPYLKGLIECPFCIGFWVAVPLGYLLGFYWPVDSLAILGGGYLLFAAREKFLPCKTCNGESVAYKVL